MFVHLLVCLTMLSNDVWLHDHEQDPLRGGKDDLFEHIVSIIHAGDEEALAKDATAPPKRRLAPEFLIKLASKISPF